MVAEVAGETWQWTDLLRALVGSGDVCQEAKARKPVSAAKEEEGRLPAAAVRSGGDCGPDTVAWLLNEHGPPLYKSRSPTTRAAVRTSLAQAWRKALEGDTDEAKAFVAQRLEQVPEAAAVATLEEQVELVLQGMLRSEPEGGAPCLPYWFLPSDWSRLSETYQVDFVLHGLPGTDGRHCARCSCEGHVHTGPQDSGRDYCLHVGWSSRGSRAWTPAAEEPEAEAENSPASTGPEVGATKGLSQAALDGLSKHSFDAEALASLSSEGDDLDAPVLRVAMPPQLRRQGDRLCPTPSQAPSAASSAAVSSARSAAPSQDPKEAAQRGGSWGHWEPLGSGPISPRQAEGAREEPAETCGREPMRQISHVQATALDLPEAAAPAGPLGSWAIGAALGCGTLTCSPASCHQTCRCHSIDEDPGHSIEAYTSPPRCGSGPKCCPQHQLCPLGQKRVHSDDLLGPAADGLAGDAGSQGRLFGSGSGGSTTASSAPAAPCRSARFCVLLGTNGSEAVAGEGFREAFAQAVAKAADVAPDRVRVLEFGTPLDARGKIPRTGSDVSSTASTATQPADTGAGVLSWLEDDAVTAPHGSEPVTRVMVAIREPGEPTDDGPSALVALERVAGQLADPNSALQADMYALSLPWGSGSPARLWASDMRAGRRRGPGTRSGVTAAPTRCTPPR